MEEVRRQRPVVDAGPPLSELAFPGCAERHMTVDEVVDYDGRLEFPEGLGIPEHELVVGEHDLPDVILEVDNTTDIRRGKLALYQAWGAPELWVEVPDYPYPNRPATLRPGLTIHLLTAGGYKEAGASRAFPSWMAEEIHWAFTEETLSRRTFATLRRVGEGMDARSGTGPQNNPLFRWQRDEGHAQGRTEGLAGGRTEGLATGRAEGLAVGRAEGLLGGQAVVVSQILRSRGIPVSPGFPQSVPNFDQAAVEDLVAAAQGCTSEADFAKRILAD